MKRKRNWKSRAAALLLACAMVVTAFPAEAIAEDTGNDPAVQPAFTNENTEETSGSGGNDSDQPEGDASSGETADEQAGQGEQTPDSAVTEPVVPDSQVPGNAEDTQSGTASGGQTEPPIQSASEGQPEDAEAGETPEEKVPRTESLDWTNRSEDLQMNLLKVLYMENEAEKEAGAADNRDDLSAAVLPDDGKIKLQLEYIVLRAENEAGEKVQPEDTLTIDFTHTDFTCANQASPAGIKDASGAIAAVWTCKDNKITVTFKKDYAVGEKVKFDLEVLIKQETLTEQPTSHEVILQKPEGKEPVKAVIVLPAKPVKEEEDQKADPAPEETPEGGQKDEPVENKPAEEVKPGEETGGKEPGEEIESQEEEKNVWESLKGKARSLFSAAAEFFTGSTEKITTKSVIKNPTDSIRKVLVALTTNKEGYIKDSPIEDRLFKFGVDITLNSDKLTEVAESYENDPNFPQAGNYPDTPEGYDQYQKDIDDFFETTSGVPVIRYAMDLGEGILLDQSGQTTSIIKKIIENDNGDIDYVEGALTDEQKAQVIGEIALVQDNGRLGVSLQFGGRIYNRTDVTLGFSQDLWIDAGRLSDQAQNITWKDGTLKLTAIDPSGDDTSTENQKYGIDKSGPEKVSSPEIPYTLTFTAPYGKTLDGMVLEEILPTVPDSAGLDTNAQKYLNVTSFSIDGKEIGPKTENNPDGYEIKAGKLYYTFPAEGAAFAEVVLNTEMTKEQKRAFGNAYSAAADRAGFQWTVTNEAHLYKDGDRKESAADSEKVSTDMVQNQLQKKGEQDYLNGDRYKWTIDVDTEFVGYAINNAYLIDYINREAHVYEPGSGQNVTVNVAVKGGNTENITAEYIDIGNLNGDPKTLNHVSDVKNLIGENKTAVYYDYGSYSVMVIPWKDAYRNHSVQVSYYTNLIKNTAENDVSNDASFVWDYTGGNGPSDAHFSISINKAGEAKPAAGSKSGIGYDEKTQTAKWRFQVNHHPSDVDLKDVQVKEVFDPVSQEPILDNSFVYTSWDRKTGSKTTGMIAEGKKDAPYYTYENNTLVIYLGDVAKDQYYDIRMNTKILDSGIQAGTSSTFTNEAVLSVQGDGTDRPETPLKGSTPTHVTWIQKDAEGKFNYDKKEFTWSVTVNPNHLNMKDAVITDILPENNRYGSLEKVVQVDEQGNFKEPGNDTVGVTDQSADTSGTVLFELKNTEGAPTTDSFILTYTTKAEDEAFKGEGTSTVRDFTNTARLGASYVIDQAHNEKVEAEDDAVNHLTINLVKKDGQYVEAEGKITWMVDVNQNQIDMKGIQVIEDLKDSKGNAMPLELDSQSVKIYKASVDENGAITQGDPTTPGSTDITFAANDRGFTYTIPETYKTQTLRFVFDTYFTDSVSAGEIDNYVTLKGTSPDFTSNGSDGNMTGNFEVDDYVNIAKTPVLRLSKISSNSVNDKEFPLEGAEFRMDMYPMNGNNNGVYTSTDKKEKTVISNQKGFATFANLKPNVLYEVTETAAPKGYQADTNPKYYLFVKADENAPASVQLDNKSIAIDNVSIYKQDSKTQMYMKDGAGPAVAVENAPKDTNKVEFNKAGNDGKVLSGIIFSLTPADGRIAKDEWKGQTSGQNGQVAFDLVDAGSDKDHALVYTLTETKNPNKEYDQGQTFTVKVWVDEKGGFQYTIEPKDATDANGGVAAEIKSDPTAGITCTNKYRTVNITLEKKDKVTEKPLAGAKFAVIASDAADLSAKYAEAESDNGGKVTFKQIPYNSNGYKIVEMSTPAGYVLPAASEVISAGGGSSAEYPVVETITKDMLEKSAAETNKASTEGKKKPSIQLSPADPLTNERAVGNILLEKQTVSGTPLADRTFQLWYIKENESGPDYYSGIPSPETQKFGTKTGVLIAEKKSDAQGKVEFDAADKYTTAPLLVWGEYYITEKIQKDDVYKKIDPIQITKDALSKQISADGKTFSYDCGIVTNTEKTGSLPIKKVVETQYKDQNNQEKKYEEPLQGATFQIFKNDGATPLEIEGSQVTGTAGADGTVTFDPLPLSEKDSASGNYLPYILKETAVPAGYSSAKTIWHLYVTPENPEGAAIDTAKVVVKEVTAEGTESTSVLYDSTDASTSSCRIVNEPVKGRIKVTKIIDGSELAAGNKLDGTPLAEVKFTLYRILGDKTEYPAAEGKTTAPNGTIEFQNIEFGNYKLVEETPNGFQTAAEISITKDDLSKDLSADSFDHSVTVANKPVKASLSLKKQDQDGNALSGIYFNVYRRGEGVKVDMSNLVVDVEKTETTYGKYSPPGTLQTDAYGFMKMSDLPYGDYLMIETGSEDTLQPEKQKVAVKITVKQDGSVNVEESVNCEFDSSTGTIKNAPDWKPISQEGNVYIIQNDLLYAFIQLNKVSAELNAVDLSTGKELAKADPGRRLSGAEFEIKKKDGEEFKHYLTLTTNEKGQFESNANGTYTDGTSGTEKYLTYGEYQIIETKAPEGFIKRDETVEFSVDQGNAGNEGTVWIEMTNTNEARYQKADQKPLNTEVWNELNRVDFTLKKYQADGTKALSGAEFIIKNDQFSAVLAESPDPDHPGEVIYRLPESSTGQNDRKDNYIYQGRILPGDYIIEETKAPAGYICGSFHITLKADGAIEVKDAKTLSSVSVDQADNSQVNVWDNAIHLTLRKTGKDGEELQGAEFEVTGIFANAGDPQTLSWSDADQAGFTAGNTYEISETKAPEGYQRFTGTKTFSVEKDGKITTADTTGVIAVDGNILHISDELLNVSFQKVDEEKQPLNGAVFTVRGDFIGGGNEIAVTPNDTEALKGRLKATTGTTETVDQFTYQVEETTIPDGYEKAENFSFTVSDTNEVTIVEKGAQAEGTAGTITVKDQPVEITLKKVDQDDAEKGLEDAEFTLEDKGPDGNATGNEAVPYTTDAKGMIILRKLILGHTYLLKETNPPKGYRSAQIEKTFKVEADGTILDVEANENQGDEIVLKNELTKAAFQKVSSEGGTVSGAVMQIKQGEIVVREWKTTDAPYLITGLEPGEYVLHEAEAPDKYLPAEDISFRLKEDSAMEAVQPEDQDKVSVQEGISTITMTDTFIRGHVKLTKTYEGTKTPVEGAVFALYRGDGTLVADKLMTDENGEWTTLYNETIRTDDPSQQLKNGLEAGSYYLQETDATEDTVLPKGEEGRWSFEVTGDNHYAGTKRLIEKTVTNKKFQASALLTKTEDREHGCQAIPKAQFQLQYSKSGEGPYKPYGAVQATDEQGTTTFENLIKGFYQVVETSNEGYEVDQADGGLIGTFQVMEEDHHQAIDLKTDRLTPVKGREDAFIKGTGIINKRLPGTVTLKKVDGEETDKALDGAEFTLERQNDMDQNIWTKIKEFFTGKTYTAAGEVISGSSLTVAGTLTIQDLDWGTYRLVETKAADGYKKGDISLEFVIERSDRDHVLKTDGHDIYNFKNEVKVKKTSETKSGIVLPDAEFIITDLDGRQVFPADGTAKTDADGLLKVEGVLTGGREYILTEVKAPAGYELTEPVPFKLEEDGTLTLPNGAKVPDELLIVPDAKITVGVKKTAADGKEELPGAVFTVTGEKFADADVEPERGITLDDTNRKDGLKGRLLPDVEYTLTETKAPEGYETAEPVKFMVSPAGELLWVSGGEKEDVNGHVINVKDHKITLEMEKLDAETGKPIADRSPAEFTVGGQFAGQEEVSEIQITSADMSALDGMLVPGRTYTAEETKAPEGYEVMKFTFTVKADGTIDAAAKISGTGQASGKDEILTVQDQPITLSLVKAGEGSDESIDTAESQAEFTVEGTFADGSKEPATGITAANISEKLKGMLTAGNTYKFTETKAPVGHTVADPFEVVIAEDGTIQKVTTNAVDASGDKLIVHDRQTELIIHKVDEDNTDRFLSGAEFTITEKGQETPVYTGTVGDGTNGTQTGVLVVTGELIIGRTYILHEQNPPAGYQRAEDVTFEVALDGTVTVEKRVQADHTITVRDALTKIQFQKNGRYNESCSDPELGAPDPDASKSLEGAVFTAYLDKECTQAASYADGRKAVETSKEDGTVTFTGLALGDDGADRTYYIKENSAPKGYVLDEAVYTVKAGSDAEFEGIRKDGALLKENTVVNDVYRTAIRFTKVDEKEPSKVLPGSTYGLYKKAAAQKALRSRAAEELQLIATAVTDENGVLAFDGVLMNTSYEIRELIAPGGCLVSAMPMRISFKTSEDGTVQIDEFDDGSGTACVDPQTGEIVWLEPQTEVYFAKKDEEGNLLAGAALHITDSDGNVIASWVSKEEEEYLIRGTLIAGETYQLEETKAPEGYELAEPVQFTVEDAAAGPLEGRTQHIEMVDKKTPVTPGEDEPGTGPDNKPDQKPDQKPNQKPDNKKKNAARTGDQTQTALWLFALLASGGILLKTGRRKR